MTTEIWMDFDPNHDIPVDLKNATVTQRTDAVEPTDMDTEFDIQDGDPEDDYLGAENAEDGSALDPPASYVILDQMVRIGADGSQVVDVLVDVEEIPGAMKYEYRITDEG